MPVHRRRAPVAGAALLLATIASLLVTATPASAQTNGFGCRAEAVNLKLFGQPPIRPLVAGSDRVCADDDGGLPEAGESTLPNVLGLDGAYAQTRLLGAGGPPAFQTAIARSGVADARIDPTGSILRVQGLESESRVTCENRQLKFTSTGHIAKLFIGGEELQINGPITRLVTALDGVTQVLIHIVPNQEIRVGNTYIFRALHVTVPENGQILDLAIGENRLAAIGDPCNDFTGPDDDDDGGGGNRPQVGFPFGGGDVIRLGDVRGVTKSSACLRSRAFGRKVAIVGTNRKDTILGSRFADRIFTFGGPDIISSGRARDCIEAGSGNDRVSGDQSGDTLYGRTGRDILDGGIGSDRLYGGRGNDRLLAGLGSDLLVGGPGRDKISGRGGGERIRGGAGNDKIYADFRGRPDRIRCGPGRDTLMADRYDKIARDCENVVINLPDSIL